ncbi:MAG: 4Fe-4S binding protein [Desulfovibrionaceae bacterium]|nr:4Fe-4S binding protein [Desulfovibrionaceae bacterium]
MFDIFLERLHQGYRTLDYPNKLPPMSPRFRGLPVLADVDCGDCRLCTENCPSGAVCRNGRGIQLDMGKCLFCGACAHICPKKAVTFTTEHRLAVYRREDLILVSGQERKIHDSVRDLRFFRRSLKLREVSAGGCNACEADTNVLGTLSYDLGHFGIDFVASPRHADGLVVTGPVTENMRLALIDTWAAVPEPKVVIAVGACAISGGLFADGGDGCLGVGAHIPVDVFVPGCPPNPWTILDGLLCAGRKKPFGFDPARK